MNVDVRDTHTFMFTRRYHTVLFLEVINIPVTRVFVLNPSSIPLEIPFLALDIPLFLGIWSGHDYLVCSPYTLYHVLISVKVLLINLNKIDYTLLWAESTKIIIVTNLKVKTIVICVSSFLHPFSPQTCFHFHLATSDILYCKRITIKTN